MWLVLRVVGGVGLGGGVDHVIIGGVDLVGVA